jgi:transposase
VSKDWLNNIEPKVIYNQKRQENHDESYLTNAEPELKKLVAKYPDATLNELCELFALKTGHWVSRSALCRALQKAGLRRKKKLTIVNKRPQNECKNCD